MTLSPALRLTLLAIAVLLFLGLAWTGIAGGINQLPQSQTTGQTAQTIAQLAYGFFALLSVVTTFWGRRWTFLVLGCWAISLMLAAGLASVVWGGTSLGIGLLSGGAALLIALGIAWLLRVGARGLTSA